MLYLIGLGLGDIKDVSVKGLEIIRQADQVFLEYYTSIFYNNQNVDHLEKFYGKKVTIVDREMVETNSDLILNHAIKENVVFLVIGDPLGATTHTDLILRAVQKNIKYKIIHNASIISAVGCCGLQLYNFGEIVSIPFWTETWKPVSFIDKINSNKKRGLHTLCLLDIKVKEKSMDALMKGLEVYDPPIFMTVFQATSQILEAIKLNAKEKKEIVLNFDDFCIGLARVGSETQKIVRCQLSKMVNIDLGPPLHCLIFEGTLHPLEEDMIKLFTI